MVVEHGRYFKSAQAGQHVVIRLIFVLIRNQLAVDILLVPNLWHLVHQALRARDFLSDGSRGVCEELLVLSLIMARVPLVILAVRADLKDKSQLLLFRHWDN